MNEFRPFLFEFWCFSLGKQARFTCRTFVPECPCEKFMNLPLFGLVCRGHSWQEAFFSLCSQHVLRNKNATKNVCDRDFAELSDEPSGAICLKPLFSTGHCPRLIQTVLCCCSSDSFGLCDSFLAPEINCNSPPKPWKWRPQTYHSTGLDYKLIPQRLCPCNFRCNDYRIKIGKISISCNFSEFRLWGAATGKTEICYKEQKITIIIPDRIFYRNSRWNDYKIKFAQNIRGPQVGGQIRRGWIWRFLGRPEFRSRGPKTLWK